MAADHVRRVDARPRVADIVRAVDNLKGGVAVPAGDQFATGATARFQCAAVYTQIRAGEISQLLAAGKPTVEFLGVEFFQRVTARADLSLRVRTGGADAAEQQRGQPAGFQCSPAIRQQGCLVAVGVGLAVKFVDTVTLLVDSRLLCFDGLLLLFDERFESVESVLTTGQATTVPLSEMSVVSESQWLKFRIPPA